MERAVADTVPAFIKEAAPPVREHLAASVELGNFLPSAGTLTLKERRLLVEQALVLFEQNYVHLPLKIAMHAVNPVQRLRVMRGRLERQSSDTMPPEWIFHAEMSEIFHSVRDLHTNYMLPEPFAGKVAYLPFLIEEYIDEQGPHYVVTRIAQGYTAPGFQRGAEVTHWSGIRIADAVDLNAARFAGSNTAARRSRGLQSLTLRPLRSHLPPFEEWVTVSYADPEGNARELREKWRVVENLPPFVDADAVSASAVGQGVDVDADETSRAKVLLFAPHVLDQQRSAESGGVEESVGAGGEVPSMMPQLFRAREVRTPSGTFGHIRIFTFSVPDPAPFVREFVRLIGLLPRDGLILDVRDNGGGLIHASEFLLQTLTPRRITPEPVQFLNTPLNLAICRAHRDDPRIDLSPWLPSMEQATETGATLSNAYPISPEEGANAVGQQYYGPVVLITNARCYSATDIFAAGFQDHEIGTVLGVDDNTGAGGANVWTHELLHALAEDVPESPYTPLPRKAGMRVSIRRTLRVGARSGTPVEDLGVIPDQRHRMTRQDVLQDNEDLLARAGELLKNQPLHALTVTGAARQDGGLRLTLETSNVDRLDLYVDQRPRTSVDVTDGHAEVMVQGVTDGRCGWTASPADGWSRAVRKGCCRGPERVPGRRPGERGQGSRAAHQGVRAGDRRPAALGASAATAPAHDHRAKGGDFRPTPAATRSTPPSRSTISHWPTPSRRRRARMCVSWGA
ncbi:S41 family peptidase [Streptomyces sp. 8N706]|uniref:S41 family peptidase n=1 Tax=Streptomyces sp. 8N706 TaxID=3457416 RepID=UPI003FCFA539